jgi:hypothetical protein
MVTQHTRAHTRIHVTNRVTCKAASNQICVIFFANRMQSFDNGH